jgi:hypothetical protein
MESRLNPLRFNHRQRPIPCTLDVQLAGKAHRIPILGNEMWIERHEP